MESFNRLGHGLLLTTMFVLGTGNMVWAQKPAILESLQEKNGVYYSPATKAPYSGKVVSGSTDIYVNGTMRNGKWHGEFAGGFDGGGESFTGSYNDGKKHGEWKTSDGISGSVVRVEYYKDDVKYNEWKRAPDGWKLFDGNGKPTTANNTNYVVEDGVLFNKNKTVLVDATNKQGAYTIPNSVTSIEAGAFGFCSGMTSLIIPNSVTTIGDGTFSGCTELTSVTIPSGLTSLKGFGFSQYPNLTAVNVASDNPRFTSENGVLFSKDKSTLIGYPAGKQGAYTVPNGVTAIGNRAFFGCAGLTSITIPNSVKTIGNEAFSGCTGLTSIIIPDGVATIGEGALPSVASIICLNVTPPKIGGSGGGGETCLHVRQGSINAYRKANYWKDFICINAITEFDTLSGNVQKWRIGKNDANVAAVLKDGTLTITGAGDMNDYDSFGQENRTPWESVKNSITTVIIMDGVTSIGENAFNKCVKLTAITIPNSVTSIGNNAFYGCIILKNIKINDGNLRYSSVDGAVFSKIKDTLFLYPAVAGAYTIPNSVKVIGDKVFQENHALTSITIPNSVISIGDLAFADNETLTSITIPNSVTFIGEFAFARNKTLKSVIISNSVTSIGMGMFSGSTGLTSITIPNGVTSIGIAAFGGCTSLTSVTIPNSIASIGQRAFFGCTGLKSVILLNPKPLTIGAGMIQDMFMNVNMANICLNVPAANVAAYRSAEGWKDFACIKGN